MGKKKVQVVKVKDYGDIYVNRLAVMLDQVSKMEEWERLAAIRFIESRIISEAKAKLGQ
jgi:hypothetical protein